MEEKADERRKAVETGLQPKYIGPLTIVQCLTLFHKSTLGQVWPKLLLDPFLFNSCQTVAGLGP